MPPRARQLIELMTLGPEDGSQPPMRLPEVAAFMKIKLTTAAQYFRHAGARAHYLRLVADLRTGELVQNFRTAVSIRDDPKMAASAAGNRSRIEAMRLLEGDGQPLAGHQSERPVTPGIVVTVNVHSADRVVDETIIEINPLPAVPAQIAVR